MVPFFVLFSFFFFQVVIKQKYIYLANKFDDNIQNTKVENQVFFKKKKTPLNNIVGKNCGDF